MIPDFVTTIGLALALVGLAISLWQVRDGKKQIRSLASTDANVGTSLSRLESVASSLDYVSHALPTKVVGEWADYLPDLAEMIDRTETRLTILCDNPAYGTWTNREGHNLYRRSIERRLVEGVAVRAIFLTREKRIALDDEFFPQEDEWTTDYSDKVDRYLTEFDSSGKTRDHAQRRAAFLEVLEGLNEKVLGQFESAALLGSTSQNKQIYSLKETSSLLPLYCWIRDGVEAIFAIAVFDGVHKEIAFSTVDPRLVAAIDAVSERFESQSTECSAELARPFAGGAPI